ncbi:MAG TPA: molybdopterin-dependent oxidoreductase [Candidatus Bathyarchaeia archaeon]|nr:molybdopterin-dependent oxidoreductase [Candidatus Bathyarchaeia archaeon]
MSATERIPTYCYQCVAGPDLLKVVVRDGVAVGVEPNCDMADTHPAGGKVCVRAYGLVQKLYNPARIRTPLRRTNPKKGRDEDPGWTPISWDEALDLLAGKLNGIRARGLTDESGYPRLAVTFGSGGIAPAYLGTFAAYLAAWGPVDQGIGSGQGVKCYHSEHLYGEFWHRAFTVAADVPRCDYVLSFGYNGDASGGVTGVFRHAEARARGLHWVQLEPHMSITAAGAQEWVPVRPKTDAAVLLALLHVVLHERDWRAVCDVPFLERMTSSPYLVAPSGYYLRDPESGKPVVWDLDRERPVPFDDPRCVRPAMDGEYIAAGIESGPDGVRRSVAGHVRPAFQLLVDHVASYTPEWAATIADVPVETIRRLAGEYLDHARVGATIEIDGVRYPHRPVAILLGKTVTNGWGGYECCWARTVLAALVGALEVPGGILGTTVRLNRPAQNRLDSVKPGPDGFMEQPLNPTGKESWKGAPHIRNAYRTLVPLADNSPWSAALGPAHLPWLFMDNPPEHWPAPTLPDVWIIYRTNPAVSNWETGRIERELGRFPFVAAFAYTQDETNWYADLLLPEATDLESLQLYRVGGTKYIEQYWQHAGWALRQPAASSPSDVRDLTDIATDLAARTGLLAEYLAALNRGSGTTVPLAGPGYDYALPTQGVPVAAEIWDRVCRAATRSLTDGQEERDLEWFKRHGAFFVPFETKRYFLHSAMAARGLRYELPYQERIKRVGEELGARLHERDIRWWDIQLEEYQPLPKWKDFPRIWLDSAALHGKDGREFPFWLLTSRSMQYSWGSNVSLPILADVARHVRGHFGVMLNRGAARRLGIADGDLIEIESPTGRTEGRAILREGIRPDVAVILQQFGHWATPFAKDLGMPNLNQVASMDLALTDATGSGADLVPVAIRPMSARSVPETARQRALAPTGPAAPEPNLAVNQVLVRGL